MDKTKIYNYILYNKKSIITFLIGSLIGALILFIIFASASNGRLFYIFTEESYKCGAIKMLGVNPNLSSFYETNYETGAHMHGCTKGIYNYKGLQCYINPNTKKYNCIKLSLLKNKI